MTNDPKHGNPAGHGDFERRDISTKMVVYFLVGLAIVTVIVHFLLVGLYDALDKHERADQPPVSPLVSNAPVDTRLVAPKYPQQAFPEPRLEINERTQLDSIRIQEEQRLNSYNWVNENAGTVSIPIDRAMDLLVQRGLPVRSQNATSTPASSTTEKAPADAMAMKAVGNKSGKKK